MASPFFKGKVIAITGGASGIGLQVATRLVEQGAKISICDFNKETLQSAERALKGAADAIVLATHVDVRETKQVDDWIAATVEQLGKLDGAVNMAGVIRGSGPITAMTDDSWAWHNDINSTGMMKSLRAEMVAMEKAEAGGSIVNAGSVSSVRGTGFYSAYVASKHAVLGLTRCAAEEGGPKRIRVNCICPAITDSPMVEAEDKHLEPLGLKMTMPNCLNRRGKADEIAQTVLFLLSDSSSFITGVMQDVTGGSCV